MQRPFTLLPHMSGASMMKTCKHSGPAGKALLHACCISLLVLGSAPGNSLAASADPVAEVGTLTLQWMGLERQQEQLRAAWRRDEPILRQQLTLLQREAGELQRVVESAEQQQDEVEQRRLALLQEQTRFEQEQQQLEQTLGQALLVLQGLRPRLPPPLQEAWSGELQRLDDPLMESGDRLRSVLELLGQLDAFEQKLSQHEGVLQVAEGQDWLVKQVYLGLTRGWYLSADGRFAGAGTATPEGWRWQPLADTAPVAAFIDILERRRSPALIDLDLELTAALPGAGP